MRRITREKFTRLVNGLNMQQVQALQSANQVALTEHTERFQCLPDGKYTCLVLREERQGPHVYTPSSLSGTLANRL